MQPEKQGFFKDTQQLAEEYIRERLLLLKLETADKSAKIASLAFTGVIIGMFLSLILILLSALGCFLLAKATGSWPLGIGSVILFYIIITTVLFAFRKKLFYKPVANFVIRIFFDKTEPDEQSN